MQMTQPAGRVAYEPNSLSKDSPRESPKGFHSAAINEAGEKGRIRPESFADHYSQARQFFVSQTNFEQSHIASALVFELSKVAHRHIRDAMVGHLRHISEDLASRVADGLGMDVIPDAPGAAAVVRDLPASPALQLIGKMKDTLMGRSIGLLVADGSDADAIKEIKNAVIKAGATVKIIAPKIAGTRLSDGSVLAADGQLAGTPSVLFDAIAIILSVQGAKALSEEAAAIDFVRDAFGHLKTIAIDKGGSVLLKIAQIAQDSGIVDAVEIDSFIESAKTRLWAREKSVRIMV